MTKDVLINLRIRENVRDDFKKVADLRGATMSGLLHQFIYKAIREEKELNPDIFENDSEISKNKQPETQELAPHSKNKIPLIDPDKKKKNNAA